jgi:hypothetical protein
VRKLAWSLAGASIAMTCTGAALAAADTGPALAHSAVFFVLVLALVLATSVIGALVASRRPSNPIGWIFLGFSVFRASSALAAGYAEVAPSRAATGLGQIAAWFFNWSYVSLFTFAVLVLLLFPDGRLAGRGRRAALWAGIGGSVALALAGAIQPGPLADFKEVDNPFGASDALAGVFALAGAVLMLTAFVAAVASVVVRFRAGSGLERQQIKWLGVAAVFTLTCVLAGLALALVGPVTAGYSLILGSLISIPVAIGVAMLRYRLYDVDRIISRSLTYALVTVGLGAAYAALVLAGQALFSHVAGGSDLAIAVSTLVVAALFLPARARVQGFVDRRFYRSRYDARRTLERFGSRLREHVELEPLRVELQDVVRETMQPVHVSLWLRKETP